jgi:hypothetical protein
MVCNRRRRRTVFFKFVCTFYRILYNELNKLQLICLYLFISFLHKFHISNDEMKWSYFEVLRDKSNVYMRVTLHWGYLIVLWLFYFVCILYRVCINLICNTWVCVRVGFVMCGCVYVWVLNCVGVLTLVCVLVICVLVFTVFLFVLLCIFILICY